MGAHRFFASRAADLARLLGILGLSAIVLASCGGNSNPNGSSSAASADTRSKAQAVSAPSAAVPSVAVASLTKVKETRVGRTLYDFEFRVNVHNSGGETAGAVIRLESAPNGTQVIDGEVAFAALPSGLSTSQTDTIVIRQDRSLPFNFAALTWSVSLQTTAPAHRVAVTISPAVSAATATSVHKFLSRLGESRPGQTLLIPTPGDETAPTVIAVDSNGMIRLAGVATSQAVELGAASTAMEMARWAAPNVPGYQGFPVFDNRVLTLSGFPALVAAVQRAHESGVPPFSNPATIAALNAVVAQVLTPPSAAPTAEPTPRMKALAIPPDRPLNGPPIPLVSMFDGRKVALQDSPFRIVNTHPLSWSVQTKDSTGKILIDPGSTPEILVPPYLLDSQLKLLFNALGGEPPPVVFPSQDQGRSIGLSLYQTPESVAYNISVVVGGFVKLALDVKGTNACLASVGKLLLGDLTGLGELIAAPSRAGMTKFLEGRTKAALAKFTGSWVAVNLKDDKTLEGCVKSVNSVNDLFVSNAAFLFPWLEAAIEGYKVGDRVVAGLTYTSMLYLLVDVLNDPVGVKSVGVCFKQFGVIGNCASALRLTPDSLLMSPGASFDGPKVSASDTSSNPTVVPHLTLELNVKQGTSSVVDALRTLDGVKISATAVGDAEVSLTDLATGATTSPGLGLLRVNVRVPKFASSTVDVNVGESVELPLVDASGRRLDYNGPTSFLASSNTIVEVSAQLNGVNETSPTRATSLRVKGLKAGEAIVWATNVATGAAFQTTVRVLGGCLASEVGELVRMDDLVVIATGGALTGFPGSFSQVGAIVNSQCDIWFNGTVYFFSPDGYGYSDNHFASQYGLAGIGTTYSVSKTGSRIYTDCVPLGATQSDQCVLNVHTRTLARLVPQDDLSGFGGTSPAVLSGDGTRLLYARRSSGGRSWHVLDVDTGSEVCVSCQIPAFLNPDGLTSLGISDDGGHVAFGSSASNVYSAIFLNVNSGIVSRITAERPVDSNSVFSGSGNYIARLEAKNGAVVGGKSVRDLDLVVFDRIRGRRTTYPLETAGEFGVSFVGPAIDALTDTAYIGDNRGRRILATKLDSLHLTQISSFVSAKGEDIQQVNRPRFLESTGTLWLVGANGHWFFRTR